MGAVLSDASAEQGLLAHGGAAASRAAAAARLLSPPPTPTPPFITAALLVPCFPGLSPHINTKYPYAVPMLTSSSCFPTLPRCWLTASGSSNPPRLFYPLALALGPYFQPPIIFLALLSSKPRVNRGNLGHSLPSTPSCRTSISSSLLNAPGSQH